MKNKGRKHKARTLNCKGWLTFITRPIASMNNEQPKSENNLKSMKFIKQKWQKRMRGYLKTSRGQEIFGFNNEEIF